MATSLKVVYCEEDLYEEGFYLACCKKNDRKVRMLHTHRDYYKVSMDWFVEEGQLRFYDLHVELRKTGKSMETTMTLLGLDHNKFTIDVTKTSELQPSQSYMQF